MGKKDEMCSVWSHSSEPGMEGRQGRRILLNARGKCPTPRACGGQKPPPQERSDCGVKTPQACGQRRTALVGELNVDL